MRQTQEKGWTFGPAPKRINCNRNYAQLKVFLRKVPRQILGQIISQALGQLFSNAFGYGGFVPYLRKNTGSAVIRAIPQR